MLIESALGVEKFLEKLMTRRKKSDIHMESVMIV